MSPSAATDPSISVIIVHFFAGDRLARVLGALAAQTMPAAEIIIVDNGSAADELQAAEGVGARIIRPGRNLGFAEGCNVGAAAATGTLLAFLNPDAYPEPGWLASLGRAAQSYGKGTVLGSVQLAADDPNRIDGLGDVYHVSGVAWRGGFGRAADARPAGDREIFAACFAAALVYGEDYRALGGLDASFFCYHEDVDFGFRHRLAGGRAVLVADAVVLHEGSGTTGRYSSFTVYHGIRNRLITFAKNMPTPLLPLALPAFLGFGVVFLIRSFMLGIGRDYCRGIAGGLLRLRAALRSRRDIQRNRKISALTALRAMRVSPLAPLRRAPDLRPINPPAAPRPHQ